MCDVRIDRSGTAASKKRKIPALHFVPLGMTIVCHPEEGVSPT